MLEGMAAPLLDHATLDLSTARRITYRLEQSFTYEYDSPITDLRHRFVVLPPMRHGDVHRRAHAMAVVGDDVRRRTCQDSAGNTVVRVRADRVERSVCFSVTALLERIYGSGETTLPATALRDPRLLRPTRLTAPDDRLREIARQVIRVGDEPVALAERICQVVHDLMTYADGVTGVRTTAAAALAGGRGVCQDSAHVMLAVCRLAGLPARYVSGHLLGQGGTHAWTEVVVPAAGAARALAFDPCNGRRAGAGHITVATGRDYADVAPTSGSYEGLASGLLTASRRVGVVTIAA